MIDNLTQLVTPVPGEQHYPAPLSRDAPLVNDWTSSPLPHIYAPPTHCLPEPRLQCPIVVRAGPDPDGHIAIASPPDTPHAPSRHPTPTDTPLHEPVVVPTYPVPTTLTFSITCGMIDYSCPVTHYTFTRRRTVGPTPLPFTQLRAPHPVTFPHTPPWDSPPRCLGLLGPHTDI